VEHEPELKTEITIGGYDYYTNWNHMETTALESLQEIDREIWFKSIALISFNAL